MPRPSNPAERIVLRRFAKAAGGREALIGWIDEALKEGRQRSGPKGFEERYTVATLMRLAEAKPKDRTKMFEQLLAEGRIGGIGTPESIVERARRNFKKGEKQLETSLNHAKAALSPLETSLNQAKAAFDQLGRLIDSLRTRNESPNHMKPHESTRSLETKTRGPHDDSGSKAPRPSKRARPRSRTKSTRPASP
jgi:hypothetical protein